MKKSEKILQQNGIQNGLSWERKTAIENNVLLKHIIDNGLNHIWWWIRIIVLMILGLYAKSFFLGG